MARPRPPVEPFGRDLPTATSSSVRAGAGMTVQVIGDGFVATHPLPAPGECRVGRASDSDLVIDHPSISRRHALFRLGPEGSAATVEDLGSANGTRVRDRKLARGERVAIAAGDVIELGDVMLVFQAGRGLPSRRPQRLFTHEHFESRLEEACRNAGHAGGRFAIARVHTAQPGDAPRVQERLAALGDELVIASYAPGELELYAPERTPEALLKELAAAAAALDDEGLPVQLGLVGFPEQGRSVDALLAAVSAAVRATPATPEPADADVVIVDPSMIGVYRLIDRVAPGDISVLLLGETGVGKELIAERLHRRSPRAHGPLVRLNCAAFTESLLESELFGHEKGAFTGATQAKPGLLEAAHGGTLFLDEVGELPPPLQPKLLRALETREVTRVGALKARKVDVRFVAATNRALERDAASGAFRQDLFFRLNGVSIVVPPLRERLSEIEPLARAFLARAARRLGRRLPSLSPEAVELLRGYQWPGNVRELKNVIERAVLLCGDAITREHLPSRTLPLPAEGPPSPRAKVEEPALQPEFEETRARILDALAACGGNQTRAAKQLGISRGTLNIWLETYRIPRPRKRSPFGT